MGGNQTISTASLQGLHLVSVLRLKRSVGISRRLVISILDIQIKKHIALYVKRSLLRSAV